MDSVNKPTDKKIPLWPGQAPQGAAGETFQPSLDLYLLPGTETRPAVVVLPGGGYSGRAAHEGVDIALRYNELGFHAFVAQYRVSPNRHPAPLLDAQRAIRLVRHHAKKWNVDTGKIAVCGFSAGGHLAGSTGVHHALLAAPGVDAADRESARPDATILCYPVLTCAPSTGHQGSFNNLLGEKATQEQRELMSLEKQVRPDTPPAFLWHTDADTAVPVENSIWFAQAMRKNKLPYELHIYPYGRHGLGLCNDEPHVLSWIELSAKFLRRMGF